MAPTLVALMVAALVAGCTKAPRPTYEYEDTVTETWTGTSTTTTLAAPPRWQSPRRW